MISDSFGDSPQGADQLLPVVIMVVYNSGVAKMASQAFYIKKMRQESLMSSESEYYLITYETALDYLIRHKAESPLEETSFSEDNLAQMEEIDNLVAKSQAPVILPESTATHEEINGLALAKFKECAQGLLWEANEKHITLKERPLSAMFVTDLERLHYEYLFIIDKYKKLSALAAGLLPERPLAAGSSTLPKFQ
jgi:hypothetical protein